MFYNVKPQIIEGLTYSFAFKEMWLGLTYTVVAPAFELDYKTFKEWFLFLMFLIFIPFMYTLLIPILSTMYKKRILAIIAEDAESQDALLEVPIFSKANQEYMKMMTMLSGQHNG